MATLTNHEGHDVITLTPGPGEVSCVACLDCGVVLVVLVKSLDYIRLDVEIGDVVTIIEPVWEA